MIDFRAIVKTEMNKTRKVILEFPWESRQAYGMWLAQTFHMVNHSTRLVALAGALTPLDRNELHARFVDHAKEERGHQLICISDLKAIDHKLEDFPCLYPSAAMYQIQYYWIQNRGVTAFFGYTLALECLATEFGPELYRRASEAHGKNAAKFLKVHSEDDVGHVQKAFEQIDLLTDEEKQMALQNLEVSANLYRSMLIEAIR